MKTKFILLIIIIVFAGCSSSDEKPELPASWFFGDSHTSGYGATPGNRWTSLLCATKKWKENNYGIPGETLLQASEHTGHGSFFARHQTAIPTKPSNGKYIFIAYGVTDCGYNFADYTTATFSTQLQTVINFSKTKGWASNDIVIVCGYFQNDNSWQNPFNGQSLPSAANMTRYNSFILAAQTVASNNAGVYFVNLFNTYDATKMVDSLHPNDAGYEAIASYIGTQVP